MTQVLKSKSINGNIRIEITFTIVVDRVLQTTADCTLIRCTSDEILIKHTIIVYGKCALR